MLAPMPRVRMARARLVAVVDRLMAGSPGLFGPGGPDERRDDALTMLLAGHDTIANALTWTWLLMANHPHVERTLHEEIDRALGAIPLDAGAVGVLPFTRSVFAESIYYPTNGFFKPLFFGVR